VPDGIHSPCNTCARDTAHEVLYSTDGSPEVLPDRTIMQPRTRVVRCRGCGQLTIRDEQWRIEPDVGEENLEEIAYSPPRLWARAPDWLITIAEMDADLKALLDEVYSATNDGQSRLLAMGVRAALDHVMVRILKGDVGPFERKLQTMVDEGHLTMTQKEILATVIDVGSASSHRGYRPARELLQEMVSEMEAVIRRHYISGPMFATARELIPPRPSRGKARPSMTKGASETS
jgi:hypothetical protein